MVRSQRIRTPLSHRWQRFRYQVVPYLAFACRLVVVALLWREQGRLPNATGIIEAVRIDVATATDGILVGLESSITRPWSLFDRVEAGQVIARLDDASLIAATKTLESESARIRKKLVAAQAEISFGDAQQEYNRSRKANRLAWQIERHRLNVLDRQVQIDIDQVNLQRRKEVIEIITPLVNDEPNSFPRLEFIEEQLRRDRVAKRIEDNQKALKEAKAQSHAAEERLRQYPTPLQAEVAALLAPIRAALDVQEARMNQLCVESQSLIVRAPMSGTIAAIYRWPGQAVVAGAPIMTIASDHGRYIVSYVRQQQRITPHAGMPVDVRIASVGHKSFATTIGRIGPQVELIPIEQLRDPKTPEWGLPIQILIPEALSARPGTRVEVTCDWSKGE